MIWREHFLRAIWIATEGFECMWLIWPCRSRKAGSGQGLQGSGFPVFGQGLGFRLCRKKVMDIYIV